MLIDDDADDLYILQRLLVKAGVLNKTIAFEDPRVALDHLRLASTNPDTRFIPCVVFCDFHMPEMNGIAVIEKIRTHETLKNIPIVMVSGSEWDGDVQCARSAGAFEFLQKYPSVRVLERLLSQLGENIHMAAPKMESVRLP